MEVLASLFSKALKLERPWEITKIEFTEAEGKIKVYIDFPRGRHIQDIQTSIDGMQQAQE